MNFPFLYAPRSSCEGNVEEKRRTISGQKQREINTQKYLDTIKHSKGRRNNNKWDNNNEYS